MSVCTAQLMQLHRMQLQPKPESAANVISREVQKRLWSFLYIQDSYLVTFKRSYSIVTSHASTPPPAHCEETEARMSKDGFVLEVPLSRATQSTYQLLQLRLASISRTLFDSLVTLQGPDPDFNAMFSHVLEADEQLIQFAQGLPAWISPYSSHDAWDDADTPPFAENVRQTFRITFLHIKMQIHRSFFCRAITDKRYYYSFHSCLEAARMIIKQYLQPRPSSRVQCWTILAHVMSACKIVALQQVYVEGSKNAPIDKSTLEKDGILMQECLESLQPLRRLNRIVDRGYLMIQRLTTAPSSSDTSYTDLGLEETTRFVREIESHAGAMRPGKVGNIDTYDHIFDELDNQELFYLS